MNQNNQKISHRKEEIREYERTVKIIRSRLYSISAVKSKMVASSLTMAMGIYALIALVTTTGFAASKFADLVIPFVVITVILFGFAPVGINLIRISIIKRNIAKLQSEIKRLENENKSI